jgi:hypothetical protein
LTEIDDLVIMAADKGLIAVDIKVCGNACASRPGRRPNLSASGGDCLNGRARVGDEFDEVPVRSLALKLAHRCTRESLQQPECTVLAHA